MKMTNRISRQVAACILGAFVFWPGAGAVSSSKHAAAPVGPGAADLRLKLSGNGRYLVNSRGKPFLVVGDSPWSLIAQLNEGDIEKYLEDRQSKGFSALIVNLIEHKFCTAPPRTRAGLAPFTAPGDFSTPNPAYFNWAHHVIEMAGRHGMVVWLAPAYLGYGGGDEGFFKEIKAGGREKLRAYGEFVGARFKDLPNIVWMLGGDYTPPPTDQWVVNDLAEAIRHRDPGHLMTAHHSPGSSALAAFGAKNWLEINNYYGYEKTLFSPMLAEFERRPLRPFVLLETTYEGEHNSTPDQIRRQAYWAMLSGACGQFFGNNPIWHFDGPGLFPVAMTWQGALNAAGSHDVALLGKLFAGLPWHQLAPEENHSMVIEGYGGDVTTALTALTPDGKLSVSYIPSTGGGARELTVAFGRFAGPVRARWYNPTNGRFIAANGSPFVNRATIRIRTPGDNGTGANDWVLVLDSN
jgi:hypothetical protein